jgi:hypothetical protein
LAPLKLREGAFNILLNRTLFGRQEFVRGVEQIQGVSDDVIGILIGSLAYSLSD